MDPDQDYGYDQGQDSGGAPSGALPDLPFTQADSLRLQKLQQGLSSAQEQVDQGVLSPEDAKQHTDQIMEQMGPLMQRQQRDQQRQEQEAIAQTQKQAAHAAAIANEDAAYRMDGMGDRFFRHVDPDSGASSWFYEKKNGEVHQADPSMYFPLGGGALQSVNADQGGTAVPPGASKDQGAPEGISINRDPNDPMKTVATPSYVTPGVEKGQRSQTAGIVQEPGGGLSYNPGTGNHYQYAHGKPATGPEAPPTAPQPPDSSAPAADSQAPTPAQQQPDTTPAGPPITMQPTQDGGHVMTIINGQTQEQWHFGQDGQTTLVGRIAPQAQQDQAPQMPGSLVSPHEQMQAFAAAQQALAQFKPNPGSYPNTPAGRTRYGQDLAQWGNHVATHARGYIQNLETERRQAQNQTAIAGRQQSAEAAKTAEAERHENVMQARQEAKDFGADVDKEVQARVGNWHKTHQDVQDMPQSIRDGIEADAETTIRNRPQWRNHPTWGRQAASAPHGAPAAKPQGNRFINLTSPQSFQGKTDLRTSTQGPS